MASKTVSVVRPTAADVRAFAASNPNKFKGLDQKTLRPGARGRLSPQVIKAYNKGRKPERQYVLGVGKAKKAEAADLRSKAVALGAGKRGPIKAAVLAQVKA